MIDARSQPFARAAIAQTKAPIMHGVTRLGNAPITNNTVSTSVMVTSL